MKFNGQDIPAIFEECEDLNVYNRKISNCKKVIVTLPKTSSPGSVAISNPKPCGSLSDAESTDVLTINGNQGDAIVYFVDPPTIYNGIEVDSIY